MVVSADERPIQQATLVYLPQEKQPLGKMGVQEEQVHFGHSQDVLPSTSARDYAPELGTVVEILCFEFWWH